MRDRRTTRRKWLQGSAVGLGAAAVSGLGGFLPNGVVQANTAVPRPKVAAIFTELRFRSHAFNILENFFEPYLFNGRLVDPGVDVVAMYADQFPADDLAREAAKRLSVPLYPSIGKALCRGGDSLAVDAVLSICEHGDYPVNPLGQREYPRKQFFDQAVAVMQAAGRFVPLFNDKHLSYRWSWAKEMYDTARRLGMPLLAGSSVPLAERRPPLDLPAEPEFDEVLATHGGGFEVYDFHGLEVLQSIVEARRGGETGIATVELLTGDEIQRAADAGRWSRALFQRAVEAERSSQAARAPRPPIGVRPEQIREDVDDADKIRHVILVSYRDGTRGTVVAAGNNSSRWNVACKLKDDPEVRATAYFNSPWGNRGLFKALSHAIQRLFVDRQEPYPVERTLLTTGALEAAVHSHHRQGAKIETPELAVAYRAGDWSRFRETGESWKIIRAETPQPTSFSPGDRKFIDASR